MNTVTTHHTYPAALGGNLKEHGELARCKWDGRILTLKDGIRATLSMDPDAVILYARQHDATIPPAIGLMPGGLSA